ncbi:amidase [Pseudooceanicola sp. 502str34]
MHIGVAEAARAIADGTLSAVQLVESCLARITAREPEVAAWEYVDAEGALARAAELDALPASLGPLHGVPFGVKDIIDCAGMPTGFGTPLYGPVTAFRDAGCVALLKEAGAICLGKTVTTELGHVSPGKTRNPFNPDRTPGGSSSGSAAAVGDGMVPFALGTQTTGSTLRPASYCGVYGYKPTRGDVSNSGVLPNAPSFDTVGVMAHALPDLPLLRAALCRDSLRPLRTVAATGLRVALFKGPAPEEPEPCMIALLQQAGARYSASGATVTTLDLPRSFDAAADLHATVSGYEFARGLSWERLTHNDALSTALRLGRMQTGLNVSAQAYQDALAQVQMLRAEFDALAGDYDVILTPSAHGEAPLGLASTGSSALNTLYSLLGVPVLSMPLGLGPNHCPIGLQLVGRTGRDGDLFDIATSLRDLFAIR